MPLFKPVLSACAATLASVAVVLMLWHADLVRVSDDRESEEEKKKDAKDADSANEAVPEAQSSVATSTAIEIAGSPATSVSTPSRTMPWTTSPALRPPVYRPEPPMMSLKAKRDLDMMFRHQSRSTGHIATTSGGGRNKGSKPNRSLQQSAEATAEDRQSAEEVSTPPPLSPAELRKMEAELLRYDAEKKASSNGNNNDRGSNKKAKKKPQQQRKKEGTSSSSAAKQAPAARRKAQRSSTEAANSEGVEAPAEEAVEYIEAEEEEWGEVVQGLEEGEEVEEVEWNEEEECADNEAEAQEDEVAEAEEEEEAEGFVEEDAAEAKGEDDEEGVAPAEELDARQAKVAAPVARATAEIGCDARPEVCDASVQVDLVLSLSSVPKALLCLGSSDKAREAEEAHNDQVMQEEASSGSTDDKEKNNGTETTAEEGGTSAVSLPHGFSRGNTAWADLADSDEDMMPIAAPMPIQHRSAGDAKRSSGQRRARARR
mmetsp:Transcript_19795/g.46033  ORF Transcript_19795/g.46033 Transcript_19795/m.46033 type:complete len:487 (+) Transcript_19795:80-1540(+)